MTSADFVGPAFNSLQPASFAGFPFPVSEITVTGGMRDHVHEYPHSPGGAPEKLGRKLYEVKYKAPFHQGLRGYPKLWPETLASLRIIYEGGKSFDLVIPTIGTIAAYCTSWEETANPRNARSGVECSFSFREDASNLFLVESLITQTVDSFKAAVPAYAGALADANALPSQIPLVIQQPDLDLTAPIPIVDLRLLTDILEAAQALYLLVSKVILIAEVLSGAIELSSMCARADVVVRTFNNPTHHHLLRTFHNLWAASRKIEKDSKLSQVPIDFFTVPRLMSITDVSRAIYGDNTHAVDLLQSNAIDNAFAIPAGVQIKAYRTDKIAA